MEGEIIVPIFLFGGTAAVLLKYFDGRHKERMAMVEKGINPADFKSIAPIKLWQGNVLSNLKWGLLLVFAGIGLFVGYQLENNFGFHEETAIFGSILIAGGLALIIFYLVAANKLKKEKQDKE
jgi:hypothetical protein